MEVRVRVRVRMRVRERVTVRMRMSMRVRVRVMDGTSFEFVLLVPIVLGQRGHALVHHIIENLSSPTSQSRRDGLVKVEHALH